MFGFVPRNMFRSLLPFGRHLVVRRACCTSNATLVLVMCGLVAHAADVKESVRSCGFLNKLKLGKSSSALPKKKSLTWLNG